MNKRNISVEPFNEINLNPNSYNYRLGDSLLVLGHGGKPLRTIPLSQEGYVLKPGKVYLGAKHERIGSDKYGVITKSLFLKRRGPQPPRRLGVCPTGPRKVLSPPPWRH